MRVRRIRLREVVIASVPIQIELAYSVDGERHARAAGATASLIGHDQRSPFQ